MVSTAKAWAVAFDFIFTIIAGAVLGWLADRWQGTNPRGLLIGLSLGFVLAFIRIVRHAQKEDRAAAAKRTGGTGKR